MMVLSMLSLKNIKLILFLSLFGCFIITTSFANVEQLSELDSKFQQAQIYVQNKDFQEAVDLLSELVEEDSENVEYYSLIGLSYQLLNDIDKAAMYFDKCIRMDPDNSMHYISRSSTVDNFQAKEAWLKKALEKDTHHDAATAVLIGLYDTEGTSEENKCHYQEAIRFAEESIRITEDYINYNEKLREPKEPEIVEILPMIKRRLSDKENWALRLRKKLKEDEPCENNKAMDAH